MPDYRQIIIGATFYGCGRAAVSPGTLVLEPDNHVGSDAVFTFNPGSDWETMPVHPWAKEFRDRLVAVTVLQENRLQVGRLSPVFAEWCLGHHVDVRLLSRVIGQDGHAVTVLSPAGRETFSAETLVDARPHRTAPPKITALVSHPPRPLIPISFDKFEILPGPFPDESYLLMDVPPGGGWRNAREQLHQFWQARPEQLAEWKLVLIGTRFDFQQFPNPVAALDAGLREVRL